MKKVYVADKSKEDIIDADNDYAAAERKRQDQFNKVNAEDFVIYGRTDKFPEKDGYDLVWNLNGVLPSEDKKIILIDPLIEHIEDLSKANELDTRFARPIKLSQFSTVLMPVSLYKEEYDKYKNIRLYEGDEELALKMLAIDRKEVYIKLDENGYVIDEKNHLDSVGFIPLLKDRIDELNDCVTTVRSLVCTKSPIYNWDHRLPPLIKHPEENFDKHSKKISGLTKETEGDIDLEDIHASTDIGKIRINQEDGVLLIKDKKDPKLKMMCVADGMGGGSRGEVASNIAINILKQWFENLTAEDKEKIKNNISDIEEDLNKLIFQEIQTKIEQETQNRGGTTLVFALISDKETLVTNIGDSRAYIAKDNHLKQVSREDTVVEEMFEAGKIPKREWKRYHSDSSAITQALGMRRRDLTLNPNHVVLNNDDYDMVLLVTDGVTDCLSEDDIAVICKNTDKKELAKKIVESALKHDSIPPEELMDYYTGYECYIPGGKDNATAAVYVPEDKEEER